MRRKALFVPGLMLLGIAASGCSGSDSAPTGVAVRKVVEPKRRLIRITNTPDAPKKAQEALILAKTGDVVEFDAGNYTFTSTLSLDVSGVTIRGQGPEKTILSFKDQGQGTGGEALLVTAKENFTLENLAFVDAKGDAVKVQGTDKVTLRNVRVSWSGGPKETNGGYGLYPVLCSNVLIENCTVSDASDAGIYVGQSQNIIVRRNTVERNVAGIEIENSTGADVYQNTATGNTGGILIFTLPDLPKKVGKNCRVLQNKVVANNLDNFAPKGNIVATVPTGTGVMIMANDDVEVFENTIENNQSAGVSVVSYLITNRPIKDQDYNPYCEGISIHDNRFSNNGTKPTGTLAAILTAVIGTPIPDIIYDGIDDPQKEDVKKEKRVALSIRGNDRATFVNFDARSLSPEKILAGKKPKIDRDPKPHDTPLPPLPAVVIEGVSR